MVLSKVKFLQASQRQVVHHNFITSHNELFIALNVPKLAQVKHMLMMPDSVTACSCVATLCVKPRSRPKATSGGMRSFTRTGLHTSASSARWSVAGLGTSTGITPGSMGHPSPPDPEIDPAGAGRLSDGDRRKSMSPD
jgi:hypothetical protein